jgi:hypothetical protein
MKFEYLLLHLQKPSLEKVKFDFEINTVCIIKKYFNKFLKQLS